MRSPRLLGLALALGAAAPVPTLVAQAPLRPAPLTAPAAAADTSARNWWLLDLETDRVAGIGAERAYRELLANRRPGRTVVVAIIDSGVDTAHADLRGNLWTNPREVAGNGRDDDGNGYVDDLHGWSFLGGKDGRNVHQETYEVTRLVARCRAGGPRAPDAALCTRVTADLETRRKEQAETIQQIRMIQGVMKNAIATLRTAMPGDSVTVERVRALNPATTPVREAKSIFLRAVAAGITPEVIESELTAMERGLATSLNPDFNPRPIVGDDPDNLSERGYGNADLTGPGADHGTHVAGIAAAMRGNAVGMDGVAPQGAVKIMVLRAVPDGDERDKDVANAIRYAVDNGAHVINMSFGKGFSPEKSYVDEAVRYADSKGVLLVHAAGNEGDDLSASENYPTRQYAGGGEPRLWIEVGASSWEGGEKLAASFSNYGRGMVDVFAPGTAIYSSTPGSEYDRNQGTSMAAPVVSGLAAMLMAYYPTLTAQQVKQIILDTATRYDQQVIKPGTKDEKVRFSELSTTGGVVNAYAAVQAAERLTRGTR